MNCIFPSFSAQKEITLLSRLIEPEAQAEELVELHAAKELEVIARRMQITILFKNKL
jgi:hypothetical protein